MCAGHRVLLVLAVVLSTRSASGQTSFDVQSFKPSLHGQSFLTVESGRVADGAGFGLHLWLVYAHRPLALFGRDGRLQSRLVEHRFDALFAAAFHFFGRVSFGVGVPVTLAQLGDLSRVPGALAALARSAFGDIRLEPKVGLLRQEQHHVDLAVLAALTLPSGFEEGFNGDRDVTAAFEVDLGRRFGPARAALNTGFLWRESTTLFDLVVGPEVYARLGAALGLEELARIPLQFFAELDARTSAKRPFASAGESPASVNLGARYSPLPWLTLTAGAGRGVVPGYGAPTVRAFFSAGFFPPIASAPAPARDAVPRPSAASRPAAPSRAPASAPASAPVDERDDDQDGISNHDDACPAEAEVFNGVDDFDGCPDAGQSLVVVTRDAIDIKEQVLFKTNGEKIERRSYALLEQVANVLKVHREIKRVRVEGHTDDVGLDQANLSLSQARADSVRDHLITVGRIAPQRLEAVGYGATRPVGANSTARGREANRRVVFAIVSGGPASAPVSRARDSGARYEPALVAPKVTKISEPPPLVVPKTAKPSPPPPLVVPGKK